MPEREAVAIRRSAAADEHDCGQLAGRGLRRLRHRADEREAVARNADRLDRWPAR